MSARVLLVAVGIAFAGACAFTSTGRVPASSGGAGGGGASTSSSSGGVTCDAMYGTAPGYQLCASRPETCDFNVDTNTSTSCGHVCGGLGGECVITIDNGTACEDLGKTQDCAYTGYSTAMCRCKLGCGAGPPCASGATCISGQCAGP